MNRTRAERRHNTHVKTSARKALAERGENYVPGGVCGGKVSLNGEACSCTRCCTVVSYERGYYKNLNDIRMVAWVESQDDSWEG